MSSGCRAGTTQKALWPSISTAGAPCGQDLLNRENGGKLFEFGSDKGRGSTSGISDPKYY